MVVPGECHLLFFITSFALFLSFLWLLSIRSPRVTYWTGIMFYVAGCKLP